MFSFATTGWTFLYSGATVEETYQYIIRLGCLKDDNKFPVFGSGYHRVRTTQALLSYLREYRIIPDCIQPENREDIEVVASAREGARATRAEMRIRDIVREINDNEGCIRAHCAAAKTWFFEIGKMLRDSGCTGAEKWPI